MSTNETLQLSAILLAPESYAAARKTVAHLRAQTIRDAIELVLVTPSLAALDAEQAELEELGAYQFVESGPMRSTAQGFTAGIRAARAPLVAFCEDHSFPDPDWAEKLVAAHQGPWAMVMPAIRNGNPETLMSWAEFFITYGYWAHPAPAGPVSHLPAHNCSFKRDELLAYGDELSDRLEGSGAMAWVLGVHGKRCYLEATTTTVHLNSTRFWSSLPVHFFAGRCFAGHRSLRWPWWQRFLYIAGAPLIPLVRLLRLVRTIRRPGRYPGSLPPLLLVLSLQLILDGLGQMLGYALGAGGSCGRLTEWELYRYRFL